MSVDINVNTEDVLNQISEDEVVAFYGAGELLNTIGVEEVKAHFGLKEEDNG